MLQQQQAQATQQLLQGQLTSTQNALQSQQRMSANWLTPCAAGRSQCSVSDLWRSTEAARTNATTSE